MARSTDNELLAKVAEGDAGAFRALLDRHEGGLRARLRGVVRDDAAAEDLMQELSLIVWERATQWDGRGSAVGWLMRIAMNLALNHLRTVRRRRERNVRPPAAPECDDELTTPSWMIDPDAQRPDELIEAEERAAAMRDLLDHLPEDKRAVIRMAHEEELRMQDIADQLGIPEGTVKSRLHYAMRDLAQAWRKRWEEA